MTITRVWLVTSGLIAAGLAAMWILGTVWSNVVGDSLFGAPTGDTAFTGETVWEMAQIVLHFAAFGAGIFLALRYFVTIGPATSWGQTVARAVAATVGGAVVALIASLALSFLDASTLGPYPLGYQLQAGVDGNNLQYLLRTSLLGAVGPLVDWMPISVLGCVLMRVWLGSGAGRDVVEPASLVGALAEDQQLVGDEREHGGEPRQ